MIATTPAATTACSTERSPLSSGVSSRLERGGRAGPRVLRLRSSPRHYDAAAFSPLLCSSPPEQDFLESVLAFSRPKETAGRASERRKTITYVRTSSYAHVTKL